MPDDFRYWLFIIIMGVNGKLNLLICYCVCERTKEAAKNIDKSDSASGISPISTPFDSKLVKAPAYLLSFLIIGDNNTIF